MSEQATSTSTKIEDPQYGRRSDLYFAAFVVTKKVNLLGAERKGRKKFFVFDATEERIKELEIAFSNRGSEDSKVSALEYADNIRSMKRLCYDD